MSLLARKETIKLNYYISAVEKNHIKLNIVFFSKLKMNWNLNSSFGKSTKQ